MVSDICIWQSYLQGVLGAAGQAEKGERQREFPLLVGSHRQSRQSHHPRPHLPDLRRLLQNRQSRHRKHRRHCRLGVCFLFAVGRNHQSRLRFPLLVDAW